MIDTGLADLNPARNRQPKPPHFRLRTACAVGSVEVFSCEHPMDRGYYLTWRKWLDSEMVGDPVAVYVFEWCKAKATHRPRKVRGIDLVPGQFLTGRELASAELKMRPGTWYSAMQRLEQWGQISLSGSRKGTIVTVSNWGTYQDSDPDRQQYGQQNVNRTSTERQQNVNTNNTLKNRNTGNTKEENACGESLAGGSKKKPKYDARAEPFPGSLSTTGFGSAWLAWCNHRTEIRKPLTATSVKQQLAGLAEIGVARAIVRINHTIAMGWTGLRDPDGNGEVKPSDMDLPEDDDQ